MDLHESAEGLAMSVGDNGKGLPAKFLNSGMGLQIMRYRASLIGASLHVGKAPGGGTLVTCVLETPPAPKNLSE